ncbi:MAG: EF-P lysine aminoacylase GenX, partial [Gammaproteobacteria bacterium HGW-Gammaproteobacteria-7]
NRNFRNEGVSTQHNPEFTLLEWYRLGWDHRRLMAEVSELVALAMADAGRPVSVESLSYAALYQRHCGLDPHLADDAALAAAFGDIRLNADGVRRDDWLDLLMTHRIQPELPSDRLTLVCDYPASQCALARLRPGDPPLAERFEAYLGQIELANGFHELANAQEQRRRFIADTVIRGSRGQAAPPLDETFLAALDHGLPDCAGVALGIDRLLMAMQGAASIDEVLAFSSGRC